MQVHDLLACFEEHTVYAETTEGNNVRNKKNQHIVGIESYQDKVMEGICGPDIWNEDLEN
jgi:hypothetical protein